MLTVRRGGSMPTDKGERQREIDIAMVQAWTFA
jgi:hypothetical protein